MTHALSREELGPERIQMLERIVAQLEGFAAGLPGRNEHDHRREPPGRRLGHPRPTFREPHVITVHGGRGSGKTSVLLSLIEAWHQRSTDASDSIEKPWTTGSTVLRQSLILASLDFDPLPKGLPLYAQFFAPFERIAKEVNKRRAKLARQEEATLEDLWCKLIEKAILGWDAPRATLSHRSVDDWAFSAREQLDGWNQLFEDWRLAIDALVDALMGDEELGDQGLLILPIDDADMQVHAVRDLLLALRQLIHPRVVFLLTADLDQIKGVLAHELEVGLLDGRERSSGPVTAAMSPVAKRRLEELPDAVVEKSLPRAWRHPLRMLKLSDACRVPFRFGEKHVTIDALFKAAGWEAERLWGENGAHALSWRVFGLDRGDRVSYRQARAAVARGLATVPGGGERKGNVKPKQPASAMGNGADEARLVQALGALAHDLINDLPWEVEVIVRDDKGPTETTIVGATALTVGPDVDPYTRRDGLYAGNSAFVHVESLDAAGKRRKADPFLPLALSVAQSFSNRWRAARPTTRPAKGWPELPDEAPNRGTGLPDTLDHSWRFYGVLGGAAVPWPLPGGSSVATHRRINSVQPELGPQDGAQAWPTHDTIWQEWISVAFETGSVRLDTGHPTWRDSLVKALASATTDHVEPASLLLQLAAPESGLIDLSRADLARLAVMYLERDRTGFQRLPDKAHRDALAAAQRARLARWELRHPAEAAGALESGLDPKAVIDLDDPFGRLVAWISFPHDWWIPQRWVERANDRLGGVGFFGVSTRDGLDLTDVLGLRIGPRGLPHFASVSLAGVLWEGRVLKRFRDALRQENTGAAGTAPRFLSSVWGGLCEHLPEPYATRVRPLLSVTEGRLKLEADPAFVAEDTLLGDKMTSHVRGTWRAAAVDKIIPANTPHDTRWQAAFTAILAAATACTDAPQSCLSHFKTFNEPKRAGIEAAKPMLTWKGTELPWPPMANWAQAEALRCLAEWSLDEALREDRRKGGDGQSQQWFFLRCVWLAAASRNHGKGQGRTEHYFQNHQLPVPFPGDAASIGVVVEALVTTIGDGYSPNRPGSVAEPEPLRDWAAHVLMLAPRRLTPLAAERWAAEIASRSDRLLRSAPRYPDFSELATYALLVRACAFGLHKNDLQALPLELRDIVQGLQNTRPLPLTPEGFVTAQLVRDTELNALRDWIVQNPVHPFFI